jgi:hypothetical protein
VEQYISPVQNRSQNPGLLKVFFAIIAFLLFLGILNYFNLLSKQTQKKNMPSLTQKLTATANPEAFTYNAEKAKTILTQFIKDTIKPELLPTDIEVKQGLTIDGRTEDVKSEFGSIFTAGNSTISANFHYKEDTNVPNDYTIFIESENIAQTTVTASLANSLLTYYFKNPNTTSSCQTKRNGYYCENFQTVTEGKNGYGILTGNDQGKINRIIFTCLIPKESKDYISFNSCLAQ